MVKTALFVLALASVMAAATLYGTVYDGEFSPVRSQVSINTTPPQVAVSANGSYAFELPEGDYVLSAASQDLTAQKDVTIVGPGQYRIDLLLLPQNPTTDPTLGDLLDEGIGTALPNEAVPSAWPAWAVVAVLLAAAGGYAFLSKKPALAQAPPVKEETQAPLSDAQKTVLSTLESFNGRASQKELRKALGQWSEAKVSMELTELEDKGLLRKIKRGRGNIIRKTG